MSSIAAGAVYVLAAFTCLACACLLARGYKRSGVRLLLWSCLCFVALTVDNVILFLDMVVFPQSDLALIRSGATLAGLGILIFGLVWDSE